MQGGSAERQDLFGLIVGAIARLVVPGKHPTGLIVPAVIGIAGL